MAYMSKARLVGAAAAALSSILAAVFAVEGGHVDNPLDPGGETNHGITKQVARESGHTGPMKALTKERAAAIYTSRYIEKPGFLPLVERDRWVAEERSEEHTSELQSLMRISYAVFCLQTNKT